MTDNFIRDYICNSIHLVSILPDAFDSQPRGKWFGDDWQGATTWAEEENKKSRNVYWTLNLVAPGLNKKPKKSDIIGIRGFGVDIDPPKGVSTWDKSGVISDLILRGQPSYVIDTGRGIQGVWLTSNPSTTHDDVESVNRGLTLAFNGDATHNVDRLFRLPGFVNYGDAKKRQAGYVPTRARLVTPFDGKVYESSYLAQYFPAPVQPVAEALPDGPDPRWTLHDVPDDEILRIMLNERPNLAASFGQGSTARDLWEGNIEGYPGQSEADMALIGKISFYWGRNPAKIEEIFSRSVLGQRGKWKERPDYRAMTIAKVVTASENVYSVERKAVAPAEPLPPLDGEVVPGGEFLTIYEQKEYFKGCVYVSDKHQVLTPSGAFMKPDQFKSYYGGHTFEVGTESAPEKNAFLALTENRLHKFPKVATTMFDPQLPFGYISDNRSAVNVYKPDPFVKATPGDVTPMLEHFKKLFPHGDDAEILWTYMAAVVQYPGEKFQWAPFIQGTPGNGKSMIGMILKTAVGYTYTHEPFSDDLANKFNDWLDFKLLIIVEELSLGERVEVENNIKTWITAEMIEMQAKGGKKSMRPNLANWLILSNYQNALPIDANQRRYAPLFTAQQSAEDVSRDFAPGHFQRLWDWLRDGGYEYMTHYLRTRPLDPRFNPVTTTKDRAPETSSTVRAISASRGRFESEVLEAVESGRKGFIEPWISSTALTALTKELHLRISTPKVAAALESLGYVKWGRSSQVIMSEGGTKPVLYVKKGGESLSVRDFEVSQGYA